jgi:hypothetical protein
MNRSHSGTWASEIVPSHHGMSDVRYRLNNNFNVLQFECPQCPVRDGTSEPAKSMYETYFPKDPRFFLSISFERLSVATSFLSIRTSFLSVKVFWILVMLKNDVVTLKNDVVMLKYDGSTLK